MTQIHNPASGLRKLWGVLLLVALLAAAGALWAQANAPELDYTAWEQTAARAEQAIEAGRASDAAFQSLRTELVDWRTKFGDAQAANTTTLQTVKDQIEALGPVPENGVEPVDISETRSELETRLLELQAPVKTAELAYTRAAGLVRGIDAIIRDRQSEALLSRGSSPLLPSNWSTAASAVGSAVSSLRGELRSAWTNEIQQAAFQRQLPIVIALLVLSLLLLFRGWHWMALLAQRLQSGTPGGKTWLLGFVASLAQPLAAFIGVIALVEAGYATGLQGLRGDQLLSALRPAGFVLFIAMWLGLRLFPKSDQEHPLLVISEEKRREGRLDAGLIGLVLGLSIIIDVVSKYEGWSADVTAVVMFPLIVLAALLMWRFSKLLRSHGQRLADLGEVPGYTDRLLGLLGRVLAVLAVTGPLLAAIGFLAAANAIIFPSLMSMLLLSFVLVVQRLIAEIWVVVSRGGETARDGLVPVLAGFALSLGSAPLFAMIWGMRATELRDYWDKAQQGFTLGDTRISAGDFLTFAVVFAAGYTLTRLLQGTLKNTVLPKTRMDKGGQTALVSGVGYVGIFLAALVAITSAGIDLSNLAIVAGALSVGIGFGLQNIVSNFVSGIILLIERPISEGDWIEVGGHMGYVRDISVRSTRIETFDRTDVIVPNADFVSGAVTNYTRGNTVGRVIVPVGVAYGTDPRLVERILREIAETHPMVLANPAPSVVFQGFGADSLDFEIRAILRDVNWMLSVKSDMNYEISRRFTEEGIEIPFAQRDVWIRNPDALPGAAAEKTAEEGETPASETSSEHLDISDFDPDGEGEGGER